MSHDKPDPGTMQDDRDDPAAASDVIALGLLSLLVGAAGGLIAVAFRLGLEWANVLRDTLVTISHDQGLAGFAIYCLGTAAAVALAAWMVRRFSPWASGSGIPHVEAVFRQDVPPAPWPLPIVKFVGGQLAMGAGLVLGREGPSVQMCASLGVMIGQLFRRPAAECRILLVAGAGAGLATAFSAPIAGAVFVLEELVQRFDGRITIAALGASAVAIGVAHLVLGSGHDFVFHSTGAVPMMHLPLFMLFGLAVGFLAVAYNVSLVNTMELFSHQRISPVLRAALIGCLVGAIAWFAPALVGGGDNITQALLLGDLTQATIAIFALRFILAILSYAAGVPGGIFAPLLVLGTEAGALFARACQQVVPQLEVQPQAFMLAGMAALFTGVIRAPVTGIVLATELTGAVELFLPMLGASFAAMLVTQMARTPPVYESLRRLTIKASR